VRSEPSSYEEARSEGYDENFDPPLESKYECPICLLGLREPVQTSCGHRFCRECILWTIRDAGPRCPVDNEWSDESQDHLKECDFVDISCPMKCRKQLKKKDLKQHFEKECPNNYYKEEVQCNGLEMEEHLDKECPQTEIKCPFYVVGCTFEGSWAAVDKHVHEQLTSHMMDMKKPFVPVNAAQSRGGMESRHQEQASHQGYTRLTTQRSMSWTKRRKRNGMSQMESLLQHLPDFVRDFDWELQNEMSKLLNPQRTSGSDWRIIASRLQLSWMIPQLEQKENPTIYLLRECTTTTSKELFEIIVDVRRVDVLEDIYKFISKRERLLGPDLPTQESLAGDSSFTNLSSYSWPVQDSGNASSLTEKDTSWQERVPQQESKKAGKDFLSDESETFWLNIDGHYEQKNWNAFYQAAKNCCPEEMQDKKLEKMLCKMLDIKYGQANDSCVSLDHFLELVALFGPMKQGPDGCLAKMYDLMKNSISVRDSVELSWFAGHMDKTEAAYLLSKQFPGHFLVRISSSRGQEGVFVLAVKTRDNGVVQIHIERDLQDGALLLAEQKFSDLMSVVNTLRGDVILRNCRQLLTNPCPSLPLNAVFRN